jgi:hypothetical protein
MSSLSSQISAHANDIALLIYTVGLIIWGVVFALVLRKKWGSWRYQHENRLSPDEWILIGLMLAGLALGVVAMLTFFHGGRIPGSRFFSGGSYFSV